MTFTGSMMGIDFTNLKYNAIYTSWGLENINNNEVIQFLKNARQALVRHKYRKGMMILKETVSLEERGLDLWYY